FILVFGSTHLILILSLIFFFQAEDGIRDRNVTGVQTCALRSRMIAFRRSAVGLVRSGARSRKCLAVGSRSPARTVALSQRCRLRSEERRVGTECGWRGGEKLGENKSIG